MQTTDYSNIIIVAGVGAIAAMLQELGSLNPIA
jgi:hypothetical protein